MRQPNARVKSRLCSLAGRCDNLMPESTISPQPGTKNLDTVANAACNGRGAVSDESLGFIYVYCEGDSPHFQKNRQSLPSRLNGQNGRKGCESSICMIV